jgi:hypothetical protein
VRAYFVCVRAYLRVHMALRRGKMRLRSRCDAVLRSWKLPLVVVVVVVVVVAVVGVFLGSGWL